jgi:poly-gamma-glutamate capsule biosynthesis protein CapA/YwtB (metallophosphatase superfamily)
LRLSENSKRITLFLCGDVMLGRGVDQILPYPSHSCLYEPSIRSAADYVKLAEKVNGVLPRTVDFSYVWGNALRELERVSPDVRIINLETSLTTSEDWYLKGINYRMHPKNIPCIIGVKIDCCVLANNHVLDW